MSRKVAWMTGNGRFPLENPGRSMLRWCDSIGCSDSFNSMTMRDFLIFSEIG
ncbi:MAG: hypothetical protein IIC60_00695 [Proteobacteria bacterium]|nr:hypothetical protein [Pseudomonadota bacterium]